MQLLADVLRISSCTSHAGSLLYFGIHAVASQITIRRGPLGEFLDMNHLPLVVFPKLEKFNKRIDIHQSCVRQWGRCYLQEQRWGDAHITDRNRAWRRLCHLNGGMSTGSPTRMK